MTVKELIEKLSEFPSDLEVDIEVGGDGAINRSSMFSVELEEMYALPFVILSTER